MPTALRYVEAKINAFHEYEIPCGLPEDSDESTRCIDPTAWVNRGCRGITNSLVNSTIRVTTAVPITLYDLGVGAAFCNGEQLRDGLITIPKATAYLVIDASKIAAICITAAVGTTAATVAVIGFGILEATKAAVTGCCHLFCRSIEVVERA